MRTTADSRADAQRLIEALAGPLPRDEARRADAVQAGLLDSGLLDRNDVGNSPAIAAAARDVLTSLAHLLDEAAPGHGAGQLLLLLLAEREAFTPYPEPDAGQLRARDAAIALLDLALWHTDDPLRLLGAALQVHAEEARSSTEYVPPRPAAGQVPIAVTPALAPDGEELHLAFGTFEAVTFSVCGQQLDRKAADTAGGLLPPECAGCFGRAALDPAPIFTPREHDAWTAFVADHRPEEA